MQILTQPQAQEAVGVGGREKFKSEITSHRTPSMRRVTTRIGDRVPAAELTGASVLSRTTVIHLMIEVNLNLAIICNQHSQYGCYCLAIFPFVVVCRVVGVITPFFGRPSTARNSSGQLSGSQFDRCLASSWVTHRQNGSRQ